MAANETYPTYPAPLAAHGPNRQLGAVACMRHMMGDGNPLGLGGLADDVTALTRVLRSLYHHFLRTLPSPYNRLSKRRATLLMTPRRLHGRHQGMNALYE